MVRAGFRFLLLATKLKSSSAFCLERHKTLSTMAVHRCALGALLLVLATLSPSPAAGDFHRGDLVPTARRAQFHGSRTHWHDLLGRGCSVSRRKGVSA